MQLNATPLGIEKICPHCGGKFSLCQHCWRGHKYCSPDCSKAARIIRHRINEQRYSNTPKGHFSRRIRQKNFRIRKILEKEVTDQSSNLKQKYVESIQTMDKPKKVFHHQQCCCCQQKLKIIKSVMEFSDPAHVSFSFTRYRRAIFDYDQKKMESKK